MSATLFPAVAAIAFAVVLAGLLFVPFLAVQYRRRGGLTVGFTVLTFAVLVYFLALATYTLLPLPELDAAFCAAHPTGPQLNPAAFLGDIRTEATGRGGGPRALLTNPALLQLVFNVALFVPLGMIVRHFGRRSVLTTTLIGLGVSLLIEFTQLTGVWFLYPCAYRLFDVDDLIVNTLGALIGAFLAPLLGAIPGQRTAGSELPRPVGALRRLLGMLSDWAIVAIGGTAVSAVYLLVASAAGGRQAGTADDFVNRVLGPAVFAALQLAFVLGGGRTLGEIVVRLRPARRPGLGRAMLRWLFGIGGYTLLGLLPGGAGFAGFVFAAVSVVLAFTSRGHRGLAYVVARLDVEDDRVGAAPEGARQPTV